MLLIFIPPSSSSTWRHPIHSTERALFSRMDEHKHMLFLPGKSHIIRNQNYSRYYRQWVRNAYISRPSPRTISSRRRFILGISKPVGSSHYDDAARWKMRGTDDFLLHEEKILPRGSRRRRARFPPQETSFLPRWLGFLRAFASWRENICSANE